VSIDSLTIRRAAPEVRRVVMTSAMAQERDSWRRATVTSPCRPLGCHTVAHFLEVDEISLVGDILQGEVGGSGGVGGREGKRGERARAYRYARIRSDRSINTRARPVLSSFSFTLHIVKSPPTATSIARVSLCSPLSYPHRSHRHDRKAAMHAYFHSQAARVGTPHETCLERCDPQAHLDRLCQYTLSILARASQRRETR